MVTMKENIEDLAKGLELVKDSNEELENMKRDYDTRMCVFENSIETLKAQQGQLHMELQRARKRGVSFPSRTLTSLKRRQRSMISQSPAPSRKSTSRKKLLGCLTATIS